jgi:hypothetical protein
VTIEGDTPIVPVLVTINHDRRCFHCDKEMSRGTNQLLAIVTFRVGGGLFGTAITFCWDCWVYMNGSVENAKQVKDMTWDGTPKPWSKT